MGRNLYLIRHGKPSFPDGAKRCISVTDLPLGARGLHQAGRLAAWAQRRSIDRIFSSPLARCVQTAQAMAGNRVPITICDDLREMGVGAWENLTFDEIRARHPEAYANRSARLGTVAPPGGESMREAAQRMASCVNGLLDQTEGDIAVVAHGGINRGFLCQAMELPPDEAQCLPQPYGGISRILAQPDGRLNVVALGEMSEPYPSEAECLFLFDQYQTPAHVQAHGKAVASCAAALASGIENVDIKLLQSAALMHDISRPASRNHAQMGAKILFAEGYPRVAEVVAMHHDLPEHAPAEAQLLYLADKMVEGETRVTVNDRFEKSKKKCQTPEALAFWQKRYQAALDIIERYRLETILKT